LIVRPRPSLLQLFFVRHGAILPRILPQILLFSGISAAVVLGHKTIPSIVPGHPPGPYALIGIALSIFFSFRNNACYSARPISSACSCPSALLARLAGRRSSRRR
jgi:ion channel-forming bestrophin family protein